MPNIVINSTIDNLQSFITNPPINTGESSFLFYFKLFSFLIIVIITFSFGLLPIFFARYRQTTILNYANPFAGGIFIGIGLFHLLPDASFDFEKYYKSKDGSSSFFYGFPMSYFIAFLSYSFILYLEKVAFSTDEKKSDKIKNEFTNDINEPLLKDVYIHDRDNIKENNNINLDIIKEENENNNEIIENENEKINNSLMYKRNKGKIYY